MGKRLECTIVHAQIEDLVRTNTADLREEQASYFAPLIDRLRAAGADCAAITSIGGHFCYEETMQVSSLPLISAIAPLDAFFVREGIGTVGLLGTRVVMRSKLYGRLDQTRALALEDEIDTIGQSYTDMALAGVCTEQQRVLFLDAGRRLVECGADAVVLAGTDLNLAFEGQPTSYRVVDALDVHVDVLAKLAADQLELDAAL